MRDEKLYNEKKERIIKTVRREETDKPVFLFDADTYYPYYAGVERSAVTSFEVAAEIMKKVTDDLQYDSTTNVFMPPNLVNQPMLDILGGGSFIINDYYKMQDPRRVMIMEADEYPAFIKNPINYFLETVFPRRFPVLASDNAEEKFGKLLQFFQEGGKMGPYQQQVEEEGTHIFCNGFAQNPVDNLFCFYREFKGIMSDVKRCPDLLAEAAMAVFETQKPLLASYQMSAAEDKSIFVPMTLPTFLRPKDFEKVYWPTFKKSAEYMVSLGLNVTYFFEKNYTHLHEYLQDLPKKGITGLFEHDDIREVKKKLGNTMAIGGGLSTDLMYNGSKEECIDHVKGLINDLCPGGGYFISPIRAMLYPTDGKPENLKAVADYIRNYRI